MGEKPVFSKSYNTTYLSPMFLSLSPGVLLLPSFYVQTFAPVWGSHPGCLFFFALVFASAQLASSGKASLIL